MSSEEIFPAGIAGITQRMVALPDGTRVHVLESGPADGEPVLLLSGWGGSAYLYRHNIAPLARTGLRVIAPELRGHGLSDKPVDAHVYGTPAMIAHAIAVMDSLGVHRAALVGQSMAGRIALGIALEQPARVSKLALISAVGTGPVHGSSLLAFIPSGAYHLVEPLVSRLVFRLVLDRAYGRAGRASRRDLEEYYAQTADPNYLRAVWSLLREFDWRALPDADFEKLRMPVLFMTGERDHVIGHERLEMLAKRMRDARVVIVPRAGHLVNEEAPEPSNRALVDFLAEK